MVRKVTRAPRRSRRASSGLAFAVVNRGGGRRKAARHASEGAAFSVTSYRVWLPFARVVEWGGSRSRSIGIEPDRRGHFATTPLSEYRHKPKATRFTPDDIPTVAKAKQVNKPGRGNYLVNWKRYAEEIAAENVKLAARQSGLAG